MDTVKYILNKSQFIEGVGTIYPVKVKDYDEFKECSTLVNYSKKHFNSHFDNDDFKLLDILIRMSDKSIYNLVTLFSLVLQKEVQFAYNESYYCFYIDDEHCINNDNYELVREVILKQNLLFEPRVFKNKLVQQWAEKVLEARSKNGVKITMEDIITTVKVYEGISYNEIAEMTLYQLNADFKRISKFMGYEKDITFLAAGADIKSVEHFAEDVDMFEDPYGNIFVNKDKVNNLNKALGQK